MSYPNSYPDLIKKFSTQDKCLDYIAAIRWKDGFCCPKCRGKKYWKSKRLLLVCSECNEQVRVLAGTLFQDTKLPLGLWFQMIWWFMGQKNGVSALALQQNFGIGSYRTAWALLGKLRSCTSQVSRSVLTGDVEVDEAYLGGVKNKELIGIAVEKRGKVAGRVRLKHLKKRDNNNIHGFIVESILPGSKIISDKYKSYFSITEKGFEHQAMAKPYSWEDADGDDERLLPHVHHVASLLKRWYLGTYHGGMDMSNIQPYLDEFVFRFNRRTSKSRGLVFHRMIEAAVQSEPVVKN